VQSLRSSTVRWFAVGGLLLALWGCGSAPVRGPGEPESAPPAKSAKGGGYYLDDGPGDQVPADLDRVPDAVPRDEPLHRYANRRYVAFGKEYVPMVDRREFRQRGIASWYGRRFHGKPTASGEPYDMYAMTAAHPTMPIPSYARVTNLANGRSVVVRINDRGPFLHDRIIDLSYAAAYKLGYVEQGSALVEVERVFPQPDAAPAVADAKDGAAPAEPAAEGNIYLQLGAFSARANAESFRERITREVAALLDRAVDIVPHQGLFRVRLGPYGSAAEAGEIAERLSRSLNFKPHILR